MMDTLYSAINALFALVIFPFQTLHAGWGVLWISFVTGLFMLFIFRFTSNQVGIRQAKTKVAAYILEMRLFNHDLLKMLTALCRILRANMLYLKFMVAPMVVIMIPVVLILIQMSYYFENRPLVVGESVIVKGFLKSDHPLSKHSVSLKNSEGFEIEAGPLRIPEFNEVNWRIRAEKEGVFDLHFLVNGRAYTKTLHVGKRLFALSPKRVNNTFFDSLLYHSEKKIEVDSPFREFHITYPLRRFEIFGFSFHWVIWFFIFSVLSGFAFKGLLKVEV